MRWVEFSSIRRVPPILKGCIGRIWKISTVRIIPGYDERNLGAQCRVRVTNCWDGQTYRELWQAAIAAAPDYVLITSWSEWHEGSEIEPSVEYGSRILDDTAAFLARQR